MFGIIVAMAALAAPQTTTPQGNGHHAHDERRDTAKPSPRPSSRNRENSQQRGEKDGRTDANAPAEGRDADGVLMPGAPGTNNPTIPNSTSSGG